MPTHPRSLTSESPQPWEARDEAQLILGQVHGVVSIAVKEVDQWLGPPQTQDREPELTADDIRAAATEIHGHFGTLQASLNTGVHDEDLAAVGLAGAQAQVKRKGFKAAIGRLFTGPKRGMNRARLRSCLRWSGTLIGSITAGLKKEIESVRGAALAAELIKEFIDVLLHASESKEGGSRTEEETVK